LLDYAYLNHLFVLNIGGSSFSIDTIKKKQNKRNWPSSRWLHKMVYKDGFCFIIGGGLEQPVTSNSTIFKLAVPSLKFVQMAGGRKKEIPPMFGHSCHIVGDCIWIFGGILRQGKYNQRILSYHTKKNTCTDITDKSELFEVCRVSYFSFFFLF